MSAIDFVTRQAIVGPVKWMSSKRVSLMDKNEFSNVAAMSSKLQAPKLRRPAGPSTTGVVKLAANCWHAAITTARIHATKDRALNVNCFRPI